MKEKMETIDVKPPSIVNRTVSLGPDSGDIKKLKTEMGIMEKKLADFKNQLNPIIAEFRTGNLMSPALAALHEKIVQIKGESENFRKEIDSYKMKGN